MVDRHGFFVWLATYFKRPLRESFLFFPGFWKANPSIDLCLFSSKQPTKELFLNNLVASSRAGIN